MTDTVKLIECPRDAWQGLKGQIPADLKTNYLQALISAGFKHIDAVSFVSPNAVPQMADSEEVLKELDPPDDVEIIGIVVNEKGAQRAIATKPCARWASLIRSRQHFLQNNQRQTLEDAIEELEKIEKKADEAGLDTVVYISMAFGNPYGDDWSVDEVVAAVGLLELQEIRTISLADTVGVASPEKIKEVVSAVMAEVRLSRNRSPPAQPSRPSRRQNSSPPMKPAAAASIPPSAAWADAPSHRMTWSGIFQRKQ